MIHNSETHIARAMKLQILHLLPLNLALSLALGKFWTRDSPQIKCGSPKDGHNGMPYSMAEEAADSFCGSLHDANQQLPSNKVISYSHHASE